MTQPYQILALEDDLQIGRLVRDQLTDLGYRVDWVVDGGEGLKRFEERHHDLVILDLMLPSLDGLEICRRIREHNRQTPILMLSAKASLHDIVLGLEMGADEYVTKPFSNAELLARIRALFRRLEAGRDSTAGEPPGQPLLRGALTIDAEKHRVELHGKPIALTAKEFALLLTFARQPGRSFSRGDLLNEVWGAEFEGFDHTVNTHINRLRTKIEQDPSQPRYILTTWGIGYRFADLDELNP